MNERQTRDNLAQLFRLARRPEHDPLDTALVAIKALVAAIRADRVSATTTEIVREVDEWARDYIEQCAQERDRQSAG